MDIQRETNRQIGFAVRDLCKQYRVSEQELFRMAKAGLKDLRELDAIMKAGRSDED